MQSDSDSDDGDLEVVADSSTLKQIPVAATSYVAPVVPSVQFPASASVALHVAAHLASPVIMKNPTSLRSSQHADSAAPQNSLTSKQQQTNMLKSLYKPSKTLTSSGGPSPSSRVHTASAPALLPSCPTTAAPAPQPPMSHQEPMNYNSSKVLQSQTKGRNATSTSNSSHIYPSQPSEPTNTIVSTSKSNTNRHHPMSHTTDSCSHAPWSSSSAKLNSSTTFSATEDAQKKKKDQFILFTRFLMKYLKQVDRPMLEKAQLVMRECAKRNRLGEPNYTSLSASIYAHLKRLVGTMHWNKAQNYCRQYIKQKKQLLEQETKERKQAHLNVNAGATSRITTTTPTPLTHQPLLTPTQQEAARRQRQLHQAQLERKRKQTAEIKEVHEKKEDLRKKTQAQQQQQALQKRQQEHQTRSALMMDLPPSKKKGAKKVDSSCKPLTPGNSKVDSKTVVSPMAIMTQESVVESRVHHPAQLREYSELMSMLDHATELDVHSAVLISGRGGDAGVLNLEEEQKQLLYGTRNEEKKNETVKGLLYGRGSLDVPTINGNTSGDKAGASTSSTTTEKLESKLPLHLKGWSERNLVSSRTAWAKLRLMEREEAKQQEVHLPTRDSCHSEEMKDMRPMITIANAEKVMSSSSCNSEWNWYNEDTAEEDQALALISEATQIYTKTLLEGAISMSRQRMNVDGIRLWHIQQSAAAMISGKGVTAGGANNQVVLSQESHNSRPPPLSLRLGCDVSRQHALAQGNAAKVCQRMEEALMRKSTNGGNERLGSEDSSLKLSEADSMDVVSKVPKLQTAVAKADYNAKRSFEVYGGKDSGNPPLGRVPKQARILKNDFQACLRDTAFALHRGGSITARS